MKKLLQRLVIDTATKYLYLAIVNGKEEIDYVYEEGHNDHSVKLMSEIERMFQDHKLTMDDIDEIIIGIGPGSYTGLRIGVVVAKMLGWNNDIPVKTISSLALIASSSNSEKWLLSEIDARRGNSFLGVYRNHGKALELVHEEELTNLEEYKYNLQEPFTVVSFGKPNINKIIESSLLHDVDDIHRLNPNYLRRTEAERNLNNS